MEFYHESMNSERLIVLGGLQSPTDLHDSRKRNKMVNVLQG
jgi:hypothetical protein